MACLKLKLVAALLMLFNIAVSSEQFSIVINQGGIYICKYNHLKFTLANTLTNLLAGSTSVNNNEIWVNGIRVVDNCTKPLSQDLQTAIDQLRSKNDTNDDTTPATPTNASNRLFWTGVQEFFDNMFDSMSKMFSATTLAIDSRMQASSAFVKVIQDKVGPNVSIQSVVAKDGCIWVNGIPIDKILSNQTSNNFIFKNI